MERELEGEEKGNLNGKPKKFQEENIWALSLRFRSFVESFCGSASE
jgi:hypothetical protein